MNKVIEKSDGEEAKESAVDEKLKMKDAHAKKLGEIAGFLHSMDDAIKAISGGEEDWKKDFPETEKKLKEIFEEHPALLTLKGAVMLKASAPGVLARRATALAARAEAFLTYLG